MILSHRHEFIFIRGRKVGGTSAELALSAICGPDDIVAPITPKDEVNRILAGHGPRNYTIRLLPYPARKAIEREYLAAVRTRQIIAPGRLRIALRQFTNHLTMRDVWRFVPQAEGYRVFCVERPPYSKVIFRATWEASRTAYATGQELGRSTSALEDGVDRLLASGNIRGVLNIDQYRDASGAVKTTARKTETLAQDCAKFISSLGCDPPQIVHAKRGLGTDSLDPRTVLRADQIDAINRIFAEEFSYFEWPLLN